MKQTQIIFLIGWIFFLSLSFLKSTNAQDDCITISGPFKGQRAVEDMEVECYFCYSTGRYDYVYDNKGKITGILYYQDVGYVTAMKTDCEASLDTAETCSPVQVHSSEMTECDPIYVDVPSDSTIID